MISRTLSQLEPQAHHSPLALLRLPELIKVVQLSRSSIYARLDESSKYYDDSFPRPVNLSPSGRGGIAWVASEVEAWIERRIEKRDHANASTDVTQKGRLPDISVGKSACRRQQDNPRSADAFLPDVHSTWRPSVIGK